MLDIKRSSDDPRIGWGPGEWLAEVERLQEELRRAEGRIEQRYQNEQVRRMKQTGYCPCCGAEA